MKNQIQIPMFSKNVSSYITPKGEFILNDSDKRKVIRAVGKISSAFENFDTIISYDNQTDIENIKREFGLFEQYFIKATSPTMASLNKTKEESKAILTTIEQFSAVDSFVKIEDELARSIVCAGAKIRSAFFSDIYTIENPMLLDFFRKSFSIKGMDVLNLDTFKAIPKVILNDVEQAVTKAGKVIVEDEKKIILS